MIKKENIFYFRSYIIRYHDKRDSAQNTKKIPHNNIRRSDSL
jgi:hypothetical protein